MIQLRIYGFPENRRREGCTFLKGVNKTTLTHVPQKRMTFKMEYTIVKNDTFNI